MSKKLNLNYGKVRALVLSIFMVTLSVSLTYQPAQAQAALISIEPNTTTIVPSTEFSVDLVVSKLPSKMYAALIIASYDPSQIELLGGDLFPPNGWCLFGYDWIEDGTGYFLVVGLGLGGVSPEATLATIDFHCLTVGTTTIDLPDSVSCPVNVRHEMQQDIETVDLSELTSDLDELSELEEMRGELLADIQEEFQFAYLACGFLCSIPFDTMDGTVNQISGTIGGTTVPINKLTLLAPYITLAAVAIGLTSIAIKKKRRD